MEFISIFSIFRCYNNHINIKILNQNNYHKKNVIPGKMKTLRVYCNENDLVANVRKYESPLK